MGDLVCMVVQPSCAWLFKSGLEHMTMTALDHARADRQVQFESAGIVQAIPPIGQVAMAVAHRGFFFRCADWLQMFLQGFQHLLDSSASQPLLLGSSPAIRFGRPAGLRRVSQILADMKEIAQKSGLGSEHLLALQPDPLRPVSHRVNMTVQSPTCLACAMAPALTGFLDAPKGGSVHDGG